MAIITTKRCTNDKKKTKFVENVELTPSDLVALLNQTLDYAYPKVTVVGELANFRISRNKWVYFDLKDDTASVKFFGTIYSLPGPLEEGMKLAVSCRPHIHELYGFSMQVSSIQPVGEGTIKKAAELLLAKLQAEGLFEQARKRRIPYPPQTIGLITSVQSAAYADFIKVLGARYGGIHIHVYDAQVQGEQAVVDIIEAITHFNNQAVLADVLVLTRGGGSADDLAAFSNEHVVRAVAASRIPTLVAIGHEIDLSLAELAADMRASTPSNAAELLVPSKQDVLRQLQDKQQWLQKGLLLQLESAQNWLTSRSEHLESSVQTELKKYQESLLTSARLLEVLSPHAALNRGYALVRSEGKLVRSVTQVGRNQQLSVQLADGTLQARVE